MLPGSQRKMLSPAWPMHSAMGKGLFLLLRSVSASEFPNILTAPLGPPLNQTVPRIGLWSRFAITPLCWVPAVCFQYLSLKIFLSLWEQTGVHILQTGTWAGENSVLFLLCTGLMREQDYQLLLIFFHFRTWRKMTRKSMGVSTSKLVSSLP